MGADIQITKPIIFFDGVCNLCNSSVNFIIDRDEKNIFKFTPLQSKVASDVLPELGIDPNQLESFVLKIGNRAYRRSRAALEIARRMRRGWPLFYVFIIIPGPIRDMVYNLVARNRYRWFGKRDECRIPTPELKARFLD